MPNTPLSLSFWFPWTCFIGWKFRTSCSMSVSGGVFFQWRFNLGMSSKAGKRLSFRGIFAHPEGVSFSLLRQSMYLLQINHHHGSAPRGDAPARTTQPVLQKDRCGQAVTGAPYLKTTEILQREQIIKLPYPKWNKTKCKIRRETRVFTGLKIASWL